jgi:dihydroneopterin aldolase
LEHVAKRILDRIFDEIAIANEATAAVSKINPPIGGNVEMVTIEMSLQRS